jgi:hypothetical protein
LRSEPRRAKSIRKAFFVSLAGVIRVGSIAAIAALGAAGAAAETIPGPPIGTPASDRAGAYCALRGDTNRNAVAFAAGVAVVAIAARRRDKEAAPRR